ncbi:MAG TPA: cobalamin-binding protein [Firmicutes bacterium]|jgi:5-methyltetrahydrofolate--homocysteine methyltransferase|nr:cobalamin-binding protein [Bacillota bacterium]
MEILSQLADAVIKGKANDVQSLTNSALAAGIAPATLINDGLIAGMQVIADRFKKNEIYVPEVLIAARAMTAGLNILKPLISDTDMKPVAKIVIGTVKGDLHDIGKKLVAMMLEGAGLTVIDLGIDVAPEKFVNAVVEHQPDLVGMSALLTTTMPAMSQTIQLLQESGLRDKVKVIIGGAPITDAYAKQIGADGYAPDAGSAVDVCKALVQTTA